MLRSTSCCATSPPSTTSAPTRTTRTAAPNSPRFVRLSGPNATICAHTGSMEQGKLTKAQRKALAKAKQDEELRQAKNDAKRKARLARVRPRRDS